MASVLIITFTVLSAIFFGINVSLFLFSTIKKYWNEKNATRSVCLTLNLCAACYLSANLVALVHYVLLTVYAPESKDLADPKYHPDVAPSFYSLAVLYIVAIMLNIYVWIKRLEHVYMNSAYGYSSKFIKRLKIGYFSMFIFVAVLLVAIPLNNGARSTAVVLIQIGAVLFVFSFACESAVVSWAFIRKLYRMQEVLLRFNGEDEEQFIFVQNLTNLQLKLTVLVSVQVTSTFTSILLALPLNGAASMATISIDCFLGFQCLYCALATHDFMFHRACCLCIRCCSLCCSLCGMRLPQKRTTNPIDKVPKKEVASKTEAETTAVEITVDGASDSTKTKDAAVEMDVDVTMDKAQKHKNDISEAGL